jgi:hypothetical protein
VLIRGYDALPAGDEVERASSLFGTLFTLSFAQQAHVPWMREGRSGQPRSSRSEIAHAPSQ